MKLSFEGRREAQDQRAWADTWRLPISSPFTSLLLVWSRVPAQRRLSGGPCMAGTPWESRPGGDRLAYPRVRRLVAQPSPRSLTFEEALQRFGLVHHLHGPPAQRVRSGRSPATAWPGGAASPARPARQSRLGSRYSPSGLVSRSQTAALAWTPPAPRPARRPQRPLAVGPSHDLEKQDAASPAGSARRATLALKSLGTDAEISLFSLSPCLGKVPDYEPKVFQKHLRDGSYAFWYPPYPSESNVHA